MATNQTFLDIDDLDDIHGALEKCGFPDTKWYKLGLRLGLRKKTLDAIEKNHPHNVYRCMTECLSQWLSRADNVGSRGGANLNSLSVALRSMNEIAVAEKLKLHVLINIFNNCHTVLSQSLCDPFATSQLLFAEHMLAGEVVSRVVSASPSIPNQREALLTAVKKAVQADPNSLHTFAKVLCTISTNVSLGQTILDDISKYFPTPEVGVVPETIKDHDVVPQFKDTYPSDAAVASNLSLPPLSPQGEVHIPVTKNLLSDFSSIKMLFVSLFHNVRKILERNLAVEDVKEFLFLYSASLKQKVEQCSDICSILHHVKDECSLTDIELLHSIVEEMNIAEAKECIMTYREKLSDACKSLSISLCLNERFDSIPHLQCQTVIFIFDWKPKEHMLEDIKEILAKVSGKLLKIHIIEPTNSISVTCSFPSSNVGFTVLRLIENIHILMGQGLKKLTIGNVTLWRRQDVRQKEVKEKDQDFLQHTEVISHIVLEEAEYKLRDAISSKEKETIELKQEISMAQVTEEELLPVQSDTELIKKEEPLYEELTVLSSQFNEIKEDNKELSDKLSKMKVKYLRSLSSKTGLATSKVRSGMSFEIDDCKFHLKAMTRPDYQPLVDNKRIIEKLQERITSMNMELINKKEHNQKIMKDIEDHLKETEEKRQKEKKQQNIEKEMFEINLICNHPVTDGELMESLLKVHKDEVLPKVLDKAYELMKLAPHIPIERCRLVKYNFWNKVMNQSFDLDDYEHLAIGQLIDEAEYLFLETRKENETFQKYNSGGINLEISVVDLSTGEFGPAEPMRGEEGWTVGELKQHIGELLNINSSCMRVVRVKEYWRDVTSVQHISNVEGTLKKAFNISGYSTTQLCVSSDPKDYWKEFKYSLMYRCVDIHFNPMLLNITMPPRPEATPTSTNVPKGGMMMKIMSINEENKGKERKIQVRVGKSITLAQLKKELVPLIGVPATGFRVYRISGYQKYGIGYEEYEMKRLDSKLMDLKSGSELIVRLQDKEGINEEIEGGITLYLLQVNNKDFCKYMMESVVAEGTPVREFKKQIIEEAKVQGIDYVLELDKMRLRDKNGMSPGTVYVDHLWVDDASMEMYVEPLKGPEEKMYYYQIQVYVIRWRPSQCSVDPIEEVILDNNNPKHLIGKLSKLSGVPANYIYCTKSQLFPVEISCLDIENKLKWYSISSDTYSLGLYVDDGYVIYYKDNRETMKELTDKERSEIQEAEEARLKKMREHNLQHGHKYWY